MPHPRNAGWHRGDHWVVCDVCGFDYRASQIRIRWDGMAVCPQDYEERHPQDFLRARKDDPRVWPVRTDGESFSGTSSGGASGGASGGGSGGASGLVCPVPISPRNGETITNFTSANLQWNTVAGITSYQVFVWESAASAPVSPTATVSITNGSSIGSYFATGLAEGTSYSWYVNTVFDGVAARNCQTNYGRSFTTNAVPQQATVTIVGGSTSSTGPFEPSASFSINDTEFYFALSLDEASDDAVVVAYEVSRNDNSVVFASGSISWLAGQSGQMVSPDIFLGSTPGITAPDSDITLTISIAQGQAVIGGPSEMVFPISQEPLAWNPLDKSADVVLSESNLVAAMTPPTDFSSSSWVRANADFADTKWYFEIDFDLSGIEPEEDFIQFFVGWATADADLSDLTTTSPGVYAAHISLSGGSGYTRTSGSPPQFQPALTAPYLVGATWRLAVNFDTSANGAGTYFAVTEFPSLLANWRGTATYPGPIDIEDPPLFAPGELPAVGIPSPPFFETVPVLPFVGVRANGTSSTYPFTFRLVGRPADMTYDIPAGYSAIDP